MLANTQLSDIKILVVEDSDVKREFLTGLLKEAGYTIDVATDGIKAIELINETAYRLVLLDIRLPKIDGLSVLKQIKQGGPSINSEVIIISSDKTSETFNSAKRLELPPNCRTDCLVILTTVPTLDLKNVIRAYKHST